MAIADRLTHHVLRLHAAIYEGTDGRIGHGMIGVPTLMLRSTGRKSGQRRTNSLVYARDGDHYLVVPSNGGAPKAPGWLHNVRAQPQVEIQIKRERRSARAEVIEPGAEDFERLWKLVNENNHDRYIAYQARTDRRIPVVAISPSS